MEGCREMTDDRLQEKRTLSVVISKLFYPDESLEAFQIPIPHNGPKH
jgi:hypothetical protein